MEQRYLRKIGTFEIFAYSEILARRKDMVEHIVASTAVREAADDVTTKASPVIEPEEAEDRLALVIEAIGNLGPDDFTAKPRNLPRVESLERILGFDITMYQRDEAWRIHNERKETESE